MTLHFWLYKSHDKIPISSIKLQKQHIQFPSCHQAVMRDTSMFSEPAYVCNYLVSPSLPPHVPSLSPANCSPQTRHWCVPTFPIPNIFTPVHAPVSLPQNPASWDTPLPLPPLLQSMSHTASRVKNSEHVSLCLNSPIAQKVLRWPTRVSCFPPQLVPRHHALAQRTPSTRPLPLEHSHTVPTFTFPHALLWRSHRPHLPMLTHPPGVLTWATPEKALPHPSH